MKGIIFLMVCIGPFWDNPRLLSENNLETYPQKRFLEKSTLFTDPRVYGQHIKLVQAPLMEGSGIEMRIDEREIIAGLHYGKAEIIKILEQYLEFENDTVKSNKSYYFRTKSYQGHWEIPKIENFTIQVEALFSFTKMLTTDIAPIYPCLIDRKTGEKINGNPTKIHQVFQIYWEWLKKNKKSDFRNFTFPLEGTPYAWQGEDLGLKSFLKRSLEPKK